MVAKRHKTLKNLHFSYYCLDKTLKNLHFSYSCLDYTVKLRAHGCKKT
jgi:hypothetical protein